MGRWPGVGDRRALEPDPTRDRAILLNQFLLGGVALVSVLVATVLGEVSNPTTFSLGTAILYAGVASAVLAPWRRLPAWVAGGVSVVDMIAIAVMRDGAPAGAFGLLWAFPAMWIASALGLAGVVAVVAGTGSLVALGIAANPLLDLTTGTVLLPLVIGALATVSFLSTRRAGAQRALLRAQSEDLKRSAERARRQEDLVTEVLDAVDFGVIRITPDGALVVTNEAQARLQDDYGEQPAAPVYAADGVTVLPRSLVPVERARRGERFENALVWYGAPGEDRRALSVTARGLLGSDGADAGTIVVSRDVTIEEQAIRAREDLVASVSHELRTPLTSIVGYLELALEHDGLPEKTRRELEVAERNATRLLELVADILMVQAAARPGAALELDLARADVAAIVRAAVEAETPRARQRRIAIDVSGLPATFAVVDARRLRQVIDNLLTNAVKYNRDGGNVRVEVSGDDADVRIAVHDDGPGVSENELPRVFDRFFRAEAVRNSSVHGSGLGLAISREIVLAHGGEITAESRRGAGSVFRIRLPAAGPGEA